MALTYRINREVLASAIAARRWSLTETATMAGISYSLIRELVSGRRETTSIATLEALSTTFGIDPLLLATVTSTKPRTVVGPVETRSARNGTHR